MTTTTVLPGISITIEPAGTGDGPVRVRLAGELDAWSGATLMQGLASLRKAGRVPTQRRGRLLLDLRDLTFLDTGGLSALADNRSALVAAGWVVVAGPAQPAVQRLLGFADRAGWLPEGPLAAEDPPRSTLRSPRVC